MKGMFQLIDSYTRSNDCEAAYFKLYQTRRFNCETKLSLCANWKQYLRMAVGLRETLFSMSSDFRDTARPPGSFIFILFPCLPIPSRSSLDYSYSTIDVSIGEGSCDVSGRAARPCFQVGEELWMLPLQKGLNSWAGSCGAATACVTHAWQSSATDAHFISHLIKS